MFKQIDYTMIVVSDMQRSVEFYRDKLGLPLKFESPDWTEFATGTTTLALHGGGVPGPPPQGDPSKRAGACSIGFMSTTSTRLTQSYRKKGFVL